MQFLLHFSFVRVIIGKINDYLDQNPQETPGYLFRQYPGQRAFPTVGFRQEHPFHQGGQLKSAIPAIDPHRNVAGFRGDFMRVAEFPGSQVRAARKKNGPVYPDFVDRVSICVFRKSVFHFDKIEFHDYFLCVLVFFLFYLTLERQTR